MKRCEIGCVNPGSHFQHSDCAGVLGELRQCYGDGRCRSVGASRSEHGRCK